MEVLNAAAMSVRYSATPSRAQMNALPHVQLTKPARIKTMLQANLASCLSALSSAVIHAGVVKALTYEEALNQTVGRDSAADIAQTLSGLLNFASDNPLIVGGAVSVIAVPLIVSTIISGDRSYGVVSAKSGYEKLANGADVQLLDIREPKEVRESGSPDVRGIGKKAVSVAYRGGDKPGFLKKIVLRFKDPGNTTLLVLDKFDGNSELVAELLTANGFKAAFAIKNGAEGPRGWKNSGLPWAAPGKTLNLDFTDIQDAISSALGDSSQGLPLTLGLAAATGLGLLAFTEIETILQLLGSAAVLQLVTKKLLFAEDRKVTLKQLDEFLNTKVAPKELADELKTIGKALLPGSSDVKALPAPTEQSSAASTPTPVEAKSEVKADPPSQINSTPSAEVKIAEVKDEALPSRPRPLSPYPNYPDFKPPSSPTPSTP